MRWTLSAFEDRLDAWIASETPDDGLRRLVTAWILTRLDDPYQEARREPDFDNLWLVVIPGSMINEQVVVCTYWIHESVRTVACDNFGTLGLPV